MQRFRALVAFGMGIGLAACTSGGGNSSAPSRDLLVSADCSPAQTSNPSIVGGLTIDATSWLGRSVVILVGTSDGGFACTATFVDQNIMLTAAHCVTREGTNQTLDPSTLKIYFSSNVLCEFKSLLKPRETVVEAIQVHPLWQGGQAQSGDLALVRIKGVIPNDYLTVDLPNFPVTFSNSSQALIAGYGNQASFDEDKAQSNLRLEFTDVKPLTEPAIVNRLAQEDGRVHGTQNFSSWTRKYESAPDSEYFTVDQRSLHGACAGDSGGPLLIRESGKFYQVGVASFVQNLNDGSDQELCHGFGMYSNVIYYHDWIQTAFSSLRTNDSLKMTPFTH